MYHFSFSAKRCITTLIVSIAFISLPAFCYNLPDFSKLVEKSSPAVVSILTFDSTKATQQLIPDDLRDDIENTPLMDMLREMYGEQVEEKLYGRDGQPGLGSGSLISEDGYIITNYHVVSGATKIYVQLKDRSQFQAHVIGFDPGTDLALLKIDGDNLPYLKFSNEPVKVGQWVVAIGAPFGFEDTLTVGVVSAKQRSLGQEKYVPFIQTDVAINPGNSGGPLLNLEGEMVGLNSQIVSESGSYAGLSFAAPSDVIQNVISQIKKNGFVERGWLGLAFQNLNRDLAESFGIKRMKGALVSKVMEDGPAQKAGLQIGDILVSMNGREIRTATDVPPLVGLLPIGSNIEIELIRKNTPMKMHLTMERTPEENKKHKAMIILKSAPVSEGILVRDLEADELVAFESGTTGVVVTHIQSAQWRIAGIRVGDVILRLQENAIKNSEDFYAKIKALPKDKPISLLVTTNGEIQRYLAVRL